MAELDEADFDEVFNDEEEVEVEPEEHPLDVEVREAENEPFDDPQVENENL